MRNETYLPELEKTNSWGQPIGPNDKTVSHACPFEYDNLKFHPLGPNEGHFIYKGGKGRNEVENPKDQEIYRLRNIINAQNEALTFWRRVYDDLWYAYSKATRESIGVSEQKEERVHPYTEDFNREAERAESEKS